MEFEPLKVCVHCGSPSVAMIVLGTGARDLVCAEHLSQRKAKHENELTPFQIVSLVKQDEGIEKDYHATLRNLGDSERANKETLDQVRALAARNAELENDTKRLARQLAEERHEHEQTRTALGFHQTRSQELEAELAQHREPEAPHTPREGAGAVVEGGQGSG